ncbi:MAG: 50S ribosomal protein L10 [Anaerolineaceae bacterium]|nr:50S ribosomal protein L10 [Anaerolineaceae bacterium]
MAFTKKKKTEMVAQYKQWLQDSQAAFILQYNHMAMKDIDGLRARVREVGGEAHVVKNTLLELALKDLGIQYGKTFTETTLIGFAFNEAPALAKVFSEASNKSEIFQIKGGFMDGREIKPGDVKALADLPPLPIMRARILGVINAPASQLVRTLAEPARSIAAVIKANSEKEAVPVA